MLACTALVGCSDDNVIDNPNENPVNGKSNAYMAIRLVNANGVASRAESDEPFEDGLADENEVSTATFYFYDEEGDFLESVKKNTSWQVEDPENDNIEMVSDAVITLENKTYEDALKYKYVIAVLNEPTAKMFDNKSKEQVEATLSTSTDATILTQDDQDTPRHIINASGNFVMANSTYVDGDNVVVASEITKDNILMQEPTKAELNYDNAVTIYVERLAAKVRVSLTSGLVDANNCISITNAIETYDSNTKEIVRDEQYKIYIEISNWGLNGTAKDSYLAKKIDKDWKSEDTSLGFAWNTHGETNPVYRTYWGKSTNYGLATGVYYPSTFFENANQYTEGNKGEGADEIQGTDANNEEVTLNYYSWNELGKSFTAGSNYDYCAENTNTADVLTSDNFFSKVTSALVKAQVVKIAKVNEDNTETVLAEKVTDDEGNETTENVKTLVRYASKLYTMDAFLARVYNEVNIEAYKYKKDADGNVTEDIEDVDWRQYIVVNDAKDGFISLSMNITDTDNWYSDKACKNNLNKDEITDVLNALHKTESNRTYIAECYNKGMMYYNIPIKHLRAGKYVEPNSTVDEETGEVVTTKFSVKEAQYGIVRNHLYDITVNTVTSMGEAVYNEYEDIIIETDTTDKWYIGTAMYVLAWRLVSQGADL